MTHLDWRGCPTTEPSIVVGFRDGSRVVLLEEDGSFVLVSLSTTAQWVAPPYGYCWPETRRLDGGRPFNNVFGFLRT